MQIVTRWLEPLRACSLTLLLTATLGQAADSPAIDFSGFNQAVRPQDDFFEHVNGQWLKETPIPADKTRWGSFVILAEESRDNVLAIIDGLSKNSNLDANSDGQKIRDLYRSYMDEDGINSLGLAPIQEELNAIERTSRSALAQEWATAGRLGISRPFSFWINQDSRDSTQYVVYFTQSGLGLPDRDYYFLDDDRSKRLQTHYQVLLTQLFTLAGIDQPAVKAYRVYELEKAIAEHQWTRVENRDRIKTYNRVSLNQLRALLPSFGWNDYLGISDIAEESHVIVRQPTYLQGLQKVIQDTSTEVWKAYYQARLLIDAAPYLGEDYFQASFDFFSKKLGGQEEPEPREKRAVSLVNGILGEVVGREYVKRHFPPQAKERMLALVGNLRKAMAESIDHLEWMDEATKGEAHKKLKKFTTKIGYPDQWKDYSKLEIKPGDLIGNLRRASEFVHAREVAKLGKPIDRTEWFMNPQTVNAYYNPQMNEIVFPAAILQPPFFNMKADDAVNYGAIGMVIGHEIGHGFDDQGRRSDGDGNLRDWWTQSDAKAYGERTRQLVDQYAQFEPLEGQKVNGQLTLGENIGDLGGLTLAWRAYQKSLEGQPPADIDGYSGAKRFFLSLAQIWRINTRPEMIMRRLKTDTHSPPKFRVNGPLTNFQPFYDVFEVSQSDQMWRPEGDRVSIW